MLIIQSIIQQIRGKMNCLHLKLRFKTSDFEIKTKDPREIKLFVVKNNLKKKPLHNNNLKKDHVKNILHQILPLHLFYGLCKYSNNMRTPLNAGAFKKWKEKARIWLHLSNTRLLSGLLLKKIHIKENMIRTLEHWALFQEHSEVSLAVCL